MELEVPTFSTLDYCVFAAMLAVSAVIGVIMSLRGNKSPDDFLLGNRAFGPIPISMSLLTSYVSAISLLGFSGEVYAHGITFATYISGVVLAIIFCLYTTLPVFFPLKLTSVNEYITLRFRSNRLRSFVLGVCFAHGLVFLGVCLYAPTIALSAVTPIDSRTYIFVLGALCTLYSAIGGIKAVVWTDVFQLTVMAIGVVVILILGCIQIGGITNVWTIAKEGQRFDFNLNIYERHSVPYLVLFGFTIYIALYGTSQINVQRICSVKTINDARIVMYLNIVGMILIYFVIFTGGLLAYATYKDCDPFELGQITKTDQIVTYYVMDKLGHVWGLPGLFVATLIGGTLSSLSSVISAQVAMIWKDLFTRFEYFAKASQRTATIINKLLSMAIGVLLIGFAIVASQAQSILQFTLTLCGASHGPILGIFLLGLLFPKCSCKGAWWGLIISLIFCGWIIIGSFYYMPGAKNLPFSIANCTNETLQIYYAASISNETSLLGEDYIDPMDALAEDELEDETSQDFQFPLAYFYGISYTLYPFMGEVLCITTGLVVSYFTGFQNMEEISPDLIAPYMRRFYWKKEQLLKNNECMSTFISISDLESRGVMLNGRTKQESETLLR